MPNYVGHGCPRLWAWIPLVLVTRTHVRGHPYPCTWVWVTTYVSIIDAFRSIFRLFCMLFRLFCTMLACFLWYFSLFYDTLMRLLWLFSEKYHSYKWLYIRYINWYFPEKWDFETFFREKTFLRVRVGATVNLKSAHSQLQKMGWGVFIVWTKTINW